MVRDILYIEITHSLYVRLEGGVNCLQVFFIVSVVLLKSIDLFIDGLDFFIQQSDFTVRPLDLEVNSIFS